MAPFNHRLSICRIDIRIIFHGNYKAVDYPRINNRTVVACYFNGRTLAGHIYCTVVFQVIAILKQTVFQYIHRSVVLKVAALAKCIVIVCTYTTAALDIQRPIIHKRARIRAPVRNTAFDIQHAARRYIRSRSLRDRENRLLYTIVSNGKRRAGAEAEILIPGHLSEYIAAARRNGIRCLIPGTAGIPDAVPLKRQNAYFLRSIKNRAVFQNRTLHANGRTPQF